MNYFELFDLPDHYELDSAALAAAYRQLQQQYHPDRFAAASEAERLDALQHASTINTAYQTLKDPLSRAEYLLALAGLDIRQEQQTMQDPEFLIQQLEWREELDDLRSAADSEAALPAFQQKVQHEAHVLELSLIQSLSASELHSSATLIRKLKFIRKLLDEVSRLEDSLLDF